jgi:predicted esterase
LACGAANLDKLVKALEELGVKVEVNDFATGHRRPPFWLD